MSVTSQIEISWATYTIDCVKESVEETLGVTLGVVGVIGLVKGNILGVDDRVGELEVQVGFAAGNGAGGLGPINESRNGSSSVRDLVGREPGEEAVQIGLGVVVTLLEDSEGVVGGRGVGTLRDFVKRGDAVRSDDLVTFRGVCSRTMDSGRSRAALESVVDLARGRSLGLDQFRVSEEREADARSDVVNMILDVLGHVVLLGGDVAVASLRVFILVVVCVQQILKLVTRGNKGQPALVVGVGDAHVMDASAGQPALDSLDGVIGGSKHLSDFILGVELAIVL